MLFFKYITMLRNNYSTVSSNQMIDFHILTAPNAMGLLLKIKQTIKHNSMIPNVHKILINRHHEPYHWVIPLRPGYKTGEGCSASTFKHGVLDAMRFLNPVFLLFENVVGVGDWTKDARGGKQEPAVKAGYVTIQYSTLSYGSVINHMIWYFHILTAPSTLFFLLKIKQTTKHDSIIYCNVQ